jgi:hypothetical protein
MLLLLLLLVVLLHPLVLPMLEAVGYQQTQPPFVRI